MNCADPFVKNGQAFGCGQCLPCRHVRARIWAHRIMLEANDHATSVFATLTYSDENLPLDGSLQPSHSRNFLKRLRKTLEPQRIRYFLVGEYGDTTQRPHYHAVLFNYPSCRNGETTNWRLDKSCCYACNIIRDAWDLGSIHLGDLTPKSASYVSGYVTKKLTSKKQDKLHGRIPEFNRMSNRPGIGANFMWDVASSLLEHPAILCGSDDVPSELCHSGRNWPLGRYLKRELRKKVGRSPDAPQSTLKAMAEKLQTVRDFAFQNSLSFKTTLVASTEQQRLNIHSRASVRKQRRSI